MRASFSASALAALLLSCFVASTATAQEAKPAATPRPTVLINLLMIDVLSNEAVDVEALAGNPSKLHQAISDVKAKVSASLELRAQSGEQGTVSSNMRLPLVTARKPVNSGGETVDQISYETAGFKLNATPEIAPDDSIRISLGMDFSGIIGEEVPTWNRSFTDKVSLRFPVKR